MYSIPFYLEQRVHINQMLDNRSRLSTLNSEMSPSAVNKVTFRHPKRYNSNLDSTTSIHLTSSKCAKQTMKNRL